MVDLKLVFQLSQDYEGGTKAVEYQLNVTSCNAKVVGSIPSVTTIKTPPAMNVMGKTSLNFNSGPYLMFLLSLKPGVLCRLF